MAKQIVDINQSNIKSLSPSLVKTIAGWSLISWQEENFEYDLPEKWRYSFLIKENETILGFCIASGKIVGAYYIHLFFTSPEVRRLGIGKMLIAEAEKRAKKYSLGKIVLRCPTINQHAVLFYQKVGFKIIDEVQDEISGKTPDYIMEKVLS